MTPAICLVAEVEAEARREGREEAHRSEPQALVLVVMGQAEHHREHVPAHVWGPHQAGHLDEGLARRLAHLFAVVAQQPREAREQAAEEESVALVAVAGHEKLPHLGGLAGQVLPNDHLVV